MFKDKIPECLDLKINGNCTKGIDCTICNNTTKKVVDAPEIKFNTNARLYIPKSKQNLNNTPNSENFTIIPDTSQTEPKIQFNLKAAEYIPKFAQSLTINDEDNLKIDDDCAEEFDLIMKDIINNELMEEMGEDESDEEKWYPKYSNCICCKGFVYKCKGSACENLGMCYCKMKEDCDYDE
jgi:hypothetical protein